MAQAYLSLKRAKELVEELATRHPRRQNPVIGGLCVYTDPKNLNRHCMVGQVIIEAGLPLHPDADGVGNDPLDKSRGLAPKGYFSDDTRLLLGEIQRVFDGVYDVYDGPYTWEGPLTWSQGLKECKARGLL